MCSPDRADADPAPGVALRLAHVPQHPPAPGRGATHDRRRRPRRRPPVRPQSERLAHASPAQRERVRGRDRRRGRCHDPPPRGTGNPSRRRRGDAAGTLAASGQPPRPFSPRSSPRRRRPSPARDRRRGATSMGGRGGAVWRGLDAGGRARPRPAGGRGPGRPDRSGPGRRDGRRPCRPGAGTLGRIRGCHRPDPGDARGGGPPRRGTRHREHHVHAGGG